MHVAGETLSFKKTGSLARFFLGSRIKSANFFHHGADRKRFRFWGHMIPVSSTRLCGQSGQREDRDKGTGRSVKQGVPTPVRLHSASQCCHVTAVRSVASLNLTEKCPQHPQPHLSRRTMSPDLAKYSRGDKITPDGTTAIKPLAKTRGRLDLARGPRTGAPSSEGKCPRGVGGCSPISGPLRGAGSSGHVLSEAARPCGVSSAREGTGRPPGTARKVPAQVTHAPDAYAPRPVPIRSPLRRAGEHFYSLV